MWSPATMTIKKTNKQTNMERYGFPVTITHIEAFLKREPIKRTTPSMTITIYTTSLQLQSSRATVLQLLDASLFQQT